MNKEKKNKRDIKGIELIMICTRNGEETTHSYINEMIYLHGCIFHAFKVC